MSESPPAAQRANEVRTFLEGLGTTSDEVAASLTAMGVKGFRVNFHNCPISRALKTAFPDLTYISVAGQRVYIEFGPEQPPVTLPQPDAVIAFIGAFDYEGLYQELNANATPTSAPTPEENA